MRVRPVLLLNACPNTEMLTPKLSTAVNGDWPLATKLPLVGGHEGAGVVVAKGDLVTDIEIGDHAGIKVDTYVQLIRLV